MQTTLKTTRTTLTSDLYDLDILIGKVINLKYTPHKFRRLNDAVASNGTLSEVALREAV